MTAKNASACSNSTASTFGVRGKLCPDAIRATKIQTLNDFLRRTGRGGRVQFTTGIVDRGTEFAKAVLNAVITFDAFSEDQDPFGEHDCASLTVMDQKILWKIDYYDRQLQYHSPDPTDPKVTVRVLTIMLSSEY